MVYGTKAIILIEVGLPTLHSTIVDILELNNTQLLFNLDLAKETRRLAQIKLASYQQTTCNFYARKVKPCIFAVKDWVLQRIPSPQKKLQ